MADLIKRDPSVVFLHQLLDELRSGQLRMPRFQRPYVWDEGQQLELLRSVRDGIPMGSILVWETDIYIPSFEQIGPHHVGHPDGQVQPQTRRYVLDGTQRLTTLLTTLIQPDRGDPPRGHAPANFAFDLEEGDFVQTPPIQGWDPAHKHFVPTTSLLDDLELLDWLELARQNGVSAERLRLVRPLARAFSTYKVPVITFTGGDLSTATRIFQRVNRQGTTMTDLHMIHALSWGADGSGMDLLSTVEDLRSSLADVGWSGLDRESILRAGQLLMGLDAQDDPEIIVRRLTQNPKAVDRACQGFRTAARILADIGLARPSLLPYDMQAVLLAAVCAEEPERVEAQAHRLQAWFWLTTYWRTLFGRPKVRPVYRHLLDTVRGEDATWPQRRWGVYDPLPSSLKGFSARVRSLGLLLVEQGPLRADASPFCAQDVYAEHGLDALPRLFARYPTRIAGMDDDEGDAAGPPLSNAGNRVLIAPQDLEALRARLLRPESCSQMLLKSHLIEEEAAAALARHDIAGFIQARERTIRAQEERKELWAREVFFGKLGSPQ